MSRHVKTRYCLITNRVFFNVTDGVCGDEIERGSSPLDIEAINNTDWADDIKKEVAYTIDRVLNAWK